MPSTAATTSALKGRLGPVGVWLGALNSAPTTAAREAAAEVDELGYGSLWVSESPVTKDPFTASTLLLGATGRLIVGTGIANVWARDAVATNAATMTIAEAYPGRFILGLGVSHQPIVNVRGHVYERPLAKMRSYLDELDAAAYEGPRPAEPAPRVLAALRPKMLELARDRADGAHPYFVPTSHTARAREALGPSPLLVPEQAVVVETDPDRARGIARAYMSMYLTLPNYVNNLRTLGFADEDVEGGGSDRLVDAVVAWGDVEAIKARVDEHLAGGADHVLLQPLAPRDGLGLDQLRTLAPALVS
ncbi:LLM class F420-dependent oxidoreductase [Actinopolymorpha alba]|uniref:LLM class F420-dependent oxidoreductase n=1 Tax=Actinopolymorpha alba TaxID=533267 RepID=UPI000380B9D4|nr:LLM class F420-dependent oxidoreductase [Actinopolymorpha alba]